MEPLTRREALKFWTLVGVIDAALWAGLIFAIYHI